MEKFWEGLIAALNAPELAADKRFHTRLERITNYEALNLALDQRFSRHDLAHWVEQLGRHDVPYAPINTIDEVTHDPQVEHLGLIVPVEARMAALARSGRRFNSVEYAAVPCVRRRCSMNTDNPYETRLHGVSGGPTCTRRQGVARRPNKTVLTTGVNEIMSILRGRWIAALTTVMAAFVAMPAPAQTAAPAQTSDLQEIIVTARKRDETVQNVPITVSVFTSRRSSPPESTAHATSSPWCRT